MITCSIDLDGLARKKRTTRIGVSSRILLPPYTHRGHKRFRRAKTGLELITHTLSGWEMAASKRWCILASGQAHPNSI